MRVSHAKPDIIVANGGPVTVAVQRETRTIPIVFASVGDPIDIGKWLELLSEIAPGLKRAALMFNPDSSPAPVFMRSLETAARSLKVAPIITHIHSDAEIETAIIALGREPGSGLVVVPDGFIAAHRAPIISAATRNKVPAVFWLSAFARK
jgi:putative ABC transport system substrate-binding protein